MNFTMRAQTGLTRAASENWISTFVALFLTSSVSHFYHQYDLSFCTEHISDTKMSSPSPSRSPSPSTSTSTNKRKRNVVSIETKLEIIKELKKGSTTVALSVKYGIPRQTISDLKRDGDKIESFASQMESLDIGKKKRKTMRKSSHEALDVALYLWFVQKRSEGIPISGPILCEKALQFNKNLNGDVNFKASSGWLQNFKSRHGIRELNIEGEKLSAASAETIAAYKKKFEELIAELGLTPDQVKKEMKTRL